MILPRRAFLSTALQTAALLTGTSALGMPAEAPSSHPIGLLKQADDPGFADAAEAVLAALGRPAVVIPLSSELLFEPAALRSALEAHRGGRMLGLMDEAALTLVEETIKDIESAVLYRGRHTAERDGTGASRHSLTTTAAAQGLGGALAQSLAASGRSFSVTETGWHGAGSGVARPALPRAEWAGFLGVACALVAAGAWRSRPVVPEIRGGDQRIKAPQTFASLVAEI